MRQYHVDIDGVRYPRDGVSVDYTSNGCNDQYRDPKISFKGYVEEELLNRFIRYTDKKNYPFQVIDLRFQVDHFIPKKIQLYEEYRGPIDYDRSFMILI